MMHGLFGLGLTRPDFATQANLDRWFALKIAPNLTLSSLFWSISDFENNPPR
jgi:hypothetical protein